MSTSLILLSVLSLAIWEAKFTPYKQSPSVQVSKCVQCAQMSKPSAARVLQCAFVHLQSSFLRAFVVQQRVCQKFSTPNL